MTQQYLGQVDLFAFPFAPSGWALCNGQLLPINQNQALYSLLGTNFGGDGKATFGLPNLQGAAVVGGTVAGSSVQNMGAFGGEATHTLTVGETPQHMHALNTDSVTTSGTTTTPGGNALGVTSGFDTQNGPFSVVLYSSSGPSGSQLDPAAIGNTGGQPHPNMMPSLGLNYCIALQGIYPSRN